MTTLKALRPLSGKYGIVGPGGTFQVNDEDAEKLEARGLAERFKAYVRPAYQHNPESFKMITSYENKAITAQPAPVATVLNINGPSDKQFIKHVAQPALAKAKRR